MISATELARLWELHAAGLALLARTRCNAAEDCVQEAFVRLSLQAVVPDDPLAWLVKVVRNFAISERRSDQRRRSREKLSSCERLARHRTQPDKDIDSISTETLQQALELLDPAMREIVVAHVWSDMSFRQIASAFEISPAMAHRRYVAALEQLSAGLGAQLNRRDSTESAL